MDNPVPPGFRTRAIAFNVLNTTAFALLIVVLIPAVFSKNVKRLKTWFGVIVSWIVFCISFLVFVGRQPGVTPETGVCLFQAAAIYAAPVYTAFAWMCYLVEVFLTISLALQSGKIRPIVILLLVIIPPSMLILVFLEVLLLGLDDPTTVRLQPVEMYCHITTGVPTRVSTALTVGAAIVAIILKVLMATTLYRNWALLRPFRVDGSVPGVQVSIIVRLFIFGTSSIIGLSFAFIIPASSVFGMEENPVWKSILLPTLPILVVLVLGTHKDVIYFFLGKFCVSDRGLGQD